MRNLGAGDQTKAIAGVRSKIEAAHFVPHIEAGKNRCWAGEAVADAQFSPRRSVDRSQRYLALRSKGPENSREDAPFLRVPAERWNRS